MDMGFFFISKIAWFLLQPLHSLMFLALAWLLLRRLGWRVLARLCGFVLVVYAGAILLTPLPEWSVRLLENRFADSDLGTSVAGIIVLGGSTDNGRVAAARGQPVLNGNVERLTTAMALHRAMPD